MQVCKIISAVSSGLCFGLFDVSLIILAIETLNVTTTEVFFCFAVKCVVFLSPIRQCNDKVRSFILKRELFSRVSVCIDKLYSYYMRVSLWFLPVSLFHCHV